MATWFAQNSSVNIDSVNQWNDDPAGAGSWLTWASLGATDILVANGKTAIAINVSFTCAKITTAATGGTAGGGFTCNTNGVTITANVEAGTTTCLALTNTSGNTVAVVGNVTGGASFNTYGISKTSTGAFNLTGNITGYGSGGNHGYGMNVTGTGAITIVGNVTGGAENTTSYGIVVGVSSHNISITGNVTGGSGATNGANAINNGGLFSGTVAITGDCAAGTSGALAGAAYAGGVGTVTVVGNIINSTVTVAMKGYYVHDPSASNYVRTPKTGGGTNDLLLAGSGGGMQFPRNMNGGLS